MAYHANPENTSVGRPGSGVGSMYGQQEAENAAYSSAMPVQTASGDTNVIAVPVEVGMAKYDGIVKMYTDNPVVFDSDVVGKIRSKDSNSL